MNRVYRKLTAGIAVLLAVALMICAMPMMAFAEAYDPENGYTEKLDGLRFWEDEKPGIRFYINAAERYLLANGALWIFSAECIQEWIILITYLMIILISIFRCLRMK